MANSQRTMAIGVALAATCVLAPRGATADERGWGRPSNDAWGLAASAVQVSRIALWAVHSAPRLDRSERAARGHGLPRPSPDEQIAAASQPVGLLELPTWAWDERPAAAGGALPLWQPSVPSQDETPYRPGLDPRIGAEFGAMMPTEPGADPPIVAVTPSVPMPSFGVEGAIADWNRRLEPPLDWRRVMVAGVGLSLHPGPWW